MTTKNCPLSGQKPVMIREPGGYWLWDKCSGLEGPLKRTEDAAIAAWNDLVDCGLDEELGEDEE